MSRLDVDVDLRTNCGKGGFLLAVLPAELADTAKPLALINLKPKNSGSYRYSFNMTDPEGARVLLINQKGGTRPLLATGKTSSETYGASVQMTLRDCDGKSSQEASRMIQLFNSDGPIYPATFSLDCESGNDGWFWFSMVTLAIIVILILLWLYRRFNPKPAAV